MRILRRKQLNSGITLPETMVATAILAVSVAAILAAVFSGFFIIERVRENQRATQIILEKLETLRLYSWSQVNSNGFIPKTFTATYAPSATQKSQGITYQGTIAIVPFPDTSANYSSKMRQVTVTLSWTSKRNIPRSRSFVTYIAEDGVQNYVY
ncbi:MAG: type II secretion system protein [Verrucomicrobiota bacterium]